MISHKLRICLVCLLATLLFILGMNVTPKHLYINVNADNVDADNNYSDSTRGLYDDFAGTPGADSSYDRGALSNADYDYCTNPNDQLADDESVPNSNPSSSDNNSSKDSSDNNNDYGEPNGSSSDVRGPHPFHKGMPKEFDHGSIWISDFRKFSNEYNHGYYRDFESLGNFGRHCYGFNPTPLEYNSHKKYVTTGADDSADMATYPHYQSLGNHTYGIMSGNKNSVLDMTPKIYNLDGTEEDALPSIYVKIKFHGSQAFSAWFADTPIEALDHMTYMGYFRKTPYHSWQSFYKYFGKSSHKDKKASKIINLVHNLCRRYNKEINWNTIPNGKPPYVKDPSFITKKLIPLFMKKSHTNKRYMNMTNPDSYKSEKLLWKNTGNKYGYITNVFHKLGRCSYRYLGKIVHFACHPYNIAMSRRYYANLKLNQWSSHKGIIEFITMHLGNKISKGLRNASSLLHSLKSYFGNWRWNNKEKEFVKTNRPKWRKYCWNEYKHLYWKYNHQWYIGNKKYSGLDQPLF